MEKQVCPHLEQCTIFNHFIIPTTSEIIKKIYCISNYGTCIRKQLKDSGDNVPEKLLPTGSYLPKYHK